MRALSRFGLLLLSVGLLRGESVLGSPYDAAILADRPMLYLPMSAPRGTGEERSLAQGGHWGTYLPRNSMPQKTRMPNGDVATVFDGLSQYFEVPSALSFSVRRGGALTLEAWIRPDTLNFPRQEGDGYVHWMGKGGPGQHEYACRMYSLSNSASPPRPNRISGYAFNLAGGLGSGSYFQDPVQIGAWIHVAVVIDTRAKPGAPTGVVSIFKNGVLRKTTPLNQFDVQPEPGHAPVRIGTRDLNSFFKGAIGKVAIYARSLTEATLREHVARMR